MKTAEDSAGERAVQWEEPPLTARERRAIREIIRHDESAAWAWAMLRNIAIWVAAIITAVTLGWEFLQKIVRAAAGR